MDSSQIVWIHLIDQKKNRLQYLTSHLMDSDYSILSKLVLINIIEVYQHNNCLFRHLLVLKEFNFKSLSFIYC